MNKISKHDFLWLFDCENGNPNGDPDTNLPRVDPETLHGYVSDVALKRRLRDYVGIAHGNRSPYAIFVQHQSNLNETIALAHHETPGGLTAKTVGPDKVQAARRFMCENFYDVRTFGALMTTGANAGQVRGPVQITVACSLSPVFPLELPISRCAVTDKAKGASTLEQFAAWREKQDPRSMRTLGRKSIIPYGLFAARGFISGHLAEQTGFNREDLALLWQSILWAFEHDRTASRGLMSTRGLYVFEHVGTSLNPAARRRESVLGCAPAHQLVELGSVVDVSLHEPNKPPRAFTDYRVEIHQDRLPPGIKFTSLA